MSLSLQEIIEEIEAAALASGFNFVSQKRVNLNDFSDTLLPAMFIKLSKLEYDKFRFNTTEEKYTFKLLMITNEAETPISSLKTLQDDFLATFMQRVNMRLYFDGEDVNLINSEITNDLEIIGKVGGESTILTIVIDNINNFY